MKRTLLTLLLFTSILKLFAQIPSNESQGLVGTNPDLSTGTVPVEIPIYTLKDGNFTMPISLSYNTSGIKVNEVASCVGLNWNLNAGGRIVRIQRDKPDEAFLGLDARGFDQCVASWHYWGYKKGEFPTFSDATLTKFRFYFLRDLEPDLFMLNIEGDNIPFMIVPGGVEKNGVRVILLNENKDIYVEYLENEYNLLQTPTEPNPSYSNNLDNLLHDFPQNLRERGCDSFYPNTTSYPFPNFLPEIAFKATFPNGTVYYFGLDVSSREYNMTSSTLDAANYFSTGGQPEKKEKHAVAGTLIASPSAWLLSKVVNPKGTVQPFNKYKLEDKFQEINFKYARSMYIMPERVWTDATLQQVNECVTMNPKVPGYNDYPLYLQAQLSSVESDNFLIKFNAPEVFALDGKVTNLLNILPDYTNGDFKNTKRIDVVGADFLNDKVQRNQNVFLNYSKTINNPLKEIPTSGILKNIMILDKSTGKKLGFYMDYEYYIQKNDKREISVLSGDIRYNTRLKLKGLYPLEIGTTSAKLLNGYQFNYNPTALPNRHTYAVDSWGYYNGNSLNGTDFRQYIPRPPLRNITNMAVTSVCFTPSSNMNPDINFAQAGILNQINYPTGGNVRYEYELHGSDNYHTSKTSTGIKIGQRPIGGLRIKKIITFEPVANKEYITKYSYNKSSNVNESSGFLSVWPEYYYVQLKRIPTSQTSTGIFFADPTNATFKFVPETPFVSAIHAGNLSSRFINGNYITYREVKVEEVTMVNNAEVTNGSTTYEYNINEKQPYAILQANGQFSYDVDNPAVNGACYNAYQYFNWNTPTYDFLKGTLKKVSVFKNGLTKPLSTTEYQYNLSNLTNTYNVKSAFLLPQTSIDVDLNGTYKGQKVVQAVGYGTSFIPQVGWIVSLIIGLVDKSISLGEPYRDLTNYTDLVQTYNQPIANYKAFKTITTNYDSNGNMPIQNTTTYGYGTTHSEPTSITSVIKNSDTTIPASIAEEKVESLVKYSREYNTTGVTSSVNESYALKLLNDRRYNVPVEIITKKNNLVVSGNYRQFSPNLTEVGLDYITYGLELIAPLSTFTLSSIVSGAVSKSTSYVPLVNYNTYNAKGLVTSFNKYKAPTTQVNYGYNQLLPTSIVMASNASTAKTINYEYDSPLFGIQKTIIPDGTYTTSEYDNLGRLKAVKDLNGNLIRSYNYNFISKIFANVSSDVILQEKSGASFIDKKTLVDNDTYQSKTGSFLNIKVNTPSVVKSIVVSFDNKYVYTTNYTNNANSFVVFGTTGFEPSVLVNGSQKIGTCKVKVQLYSDTDGRGDLIGTKNINFSIY